MFSIKAGALLISLASDALDAFKLSLADAVNVNVPPEPTAALCVLTVTPAEPSANEISACETFSAKEDDITNVAPGVDAPGATIGILVAPSDDFATT